MKASELIANLQRMVETYGDVPVVLPAGDIPPDTEDSDTASLVSIAAMQGDEEQIAYFVLCDQLMADAFDSAFDAAEETRSLEQ